MLVSIPTTTPSDDIEEEACRLPIAMVRCGPPPCWPRWPCRSPSPRRPSSRPPSTPDGEVFSLKLPAGSCAATEANGTVQFIGTATVLIRYQGLTILTDPNFLHKGDHVHLGYGLTVRAPDQSRHRARQAAADRPGGAVAHARGPFRQAGAGKAAEGHADRHHQAKRRASLEKLGFSARIGARKWDQLEVEKGESRCASRPPGATARPACRCCCPA
jgi:hypothetical protein